MQCQSFTLRMDNARDLEQLNRFLAQVMPLQVSSSLVQGNPAFWSVLVFYEGEVKQTPAIPSKEAVAKPAAVLAGSPAYEALRKWRSQKAREEDIPAYVVATNAELEAIAGLKAPTLKDLEGIKGFGKLKLNKYGADILEVLRSL